MPATKTRSGCDHELNCIVLVETHREFGAIGALRFDDCAQRHHAPRAVLHIEAPQLFGVVSEFALGFDVDLPDSTKPVEIVDEKSSSRKRYFDRKIEWLEAAIPLAKTEDDLKNLKIEINNAKAEYNGDIIQVN